jgi:hypothetical protein
MAEIESLQVYLSSKYATSYNNKSYSDCNFNLPCLEIPTQHHIYISVVNATIPYAFYNIDDKNNVINYCEIDMDNVIISSKILYITIGNYNVMQLATYLSSGVLPNLTVTYNNIQSTFIFTNSTNNFRFYDTNSTSYSLLGLVFSILGYTESSTKVLTSINVVNLASKQCIYVSSSFETGSINNLLNNQHRILCSIPILTPPFSLITYTNNNNFRVNLYNNIINNISIQLIDQDGNLLNLNNQYFSITIQLDVVKFV